MSQLVERTTDSFGDYTTRWECKQPAEHVPFRVLVESWNESFTERTIWRIAPANAHAALLDRAFGPEQEGKS